MAAAVSGGVGAQGQSMMTHHVREAVKNGKAQANGHLPAGQIMSLDLVLPLRDAAGLDNFLAELNDPTSPSYRQYLTPAQFAAKFGPSETDYAAVVQFAQTHGFTVTGGSAAGHDVQVKGPVSAVESAFHVHMNTYKHPSENRTFYAPDAEPTTDLTINLWHVSGLDNFSIPQPRMVNKDQYAAAHGISPDQVVAHATTGSGPSASFLGSDMRAAYYGSGSLTGTGQTIGLLEYYGTDLVDLQNYYTNIGQPYPGSKVHLLSVDGTSTSCVYSGASRCDDGEQNLDMTQALGMAPGITELTMYIGSSDTAILSKMVAPPSGTPLASTIGCSWGWTPVDPSTLDPYFKQMQAQGQTFLAASGDSSTWSKSVVAWPADDLYVVSVGGTDLVTASAAGPWQSETAWVDSGGGINVDGIAIPSWQQIPGVVTTSNKASSTYRNGPDVAANANFTFYTCGDQQACQSNYYGGTSFAAPMWAGYLALVNQQLASNGQGPVGFINPTIYQQNVGSQYGTDFHDVTSGTSGSYSAVTGYDLVTGWGSPTPALVSALTGGTTQQTPDFGISATAASAKQGGTGTSTVTITPSNGFNSAVTLSAANLPSGVTVAFNPASITGSGSSTATFTVGSTAAPGSYTVTITGTSGSTVHSATMTLTVSSSTSSNYSISAGSGTTTVSRGSAAARTLTLSGTVSSGTVTFAASGLGNGVSVSFNPSSLGGPGSTAMTLTAARNASIGTRTVTVTASGAGSSATTTFTLSVTH